MSFFFLGGASSAVDDDDVTTSVLVTVAVVVPVPTSALILSLTIFRLERVLVASLAEPREPRVTNPNPRGRELPPTVPKAPDTLRRRGVLVAGVVLLPGCVWI